MDTEETELVGHVDALNRRMMHPVSPIPIIHLMPFTRFLFSHIHFSPSFVPCSPPFPFEQC
jgi:hypothetical protein